METSDGLEALSGGDRTFTFKAYHQRVNQLAHYLLEEGVQKGDHIAVLCKNNHHFPVILLASLKIGATVVPLSWQLTSYELKGILQHVSVDGRKRHHHMNVFLLDLLQDFKRFGVP